MEIIENTFNKDLRIPRALKDKRICFLDIETTGLSRMKDNIYLIGRVFFDEEIKSGKLSQFFAEELKEEVDILLKVYELIKGFDLIINYNGSSFDLPFINSKLEYYKRGLKIDLNKSLDLLRIVKNNRYILGLESFRLEDVEEYLGIYRSDQYSGRECIKVYLDYIVSKDPSLKERILLHNYEDLYYLLDVISILDEIEDLKSFKIYHMEETIKFNIEQIYFEKDYLFVDGNIENNKLGNVKHFADGYQINISKEGHFEIALENREGLVTPTKRCRFLMAENLGLNTEEFINKANKEYRIPKGIILLQVEKYLFMDNIKAVLKGLIEKIIHQLY